MAVPEAGSAAAAVGSVAGLGADTAAVLVTAAGSVVVAVLGADTAAVAGPVAVPRVDTAAAQSVAVSVAVAGPVAGG